MYPPASWKHLPKNMNLLATKAAEWSTRRIALLIFPRVHLMNLAGPLDVFARASQALTRAGKRHSHAYEIQLLTMDEMPLVTASGLSLVAGRQWTQALTPIDTLLLVASSTEMDSPVAPELLGWLRASVDGVRRIGSVC